MDKSGQYGQCEMSFFIFVHPFLLNRLLTSTVSIFFVLIFILCLSSCNQERATKFEGYIEAEYLYIASPFAGRLETLSVQKGQEVDADDPLFILEHTSEAAQLASAEAQLQVAKFQKGDLLKGKRREEIDVIKAQLQQAIAQEKLSSLELDRDEKQFALEAIPQAQLDRSQTAHQRDREKVAELRFQILSYELPGRPDQILAQSAQVKSAEALLADAKWKLSQKFLKAPFGGFIFDTLFVEGEWVEAGRPVVVLLTPNHIKIRFFVQESLLGSLKLGQGVNVFCDGCENAILAHISYISPEAEYTPPIIFSNETRTKLIFMVEALPDTKEALKLHPGQPVEVYFR